MYVAYGSPEIHELECTTSSLDPSRQYLLTLDDHRIELFKVGQDLSHQTRIAREELPSTTVLSKSWIVWHSSSKFVAILTDQIVDIYKIERLEQESIDDSLPIPKWIDAESAEQLQKETYQLRYQYQQAITQDQESSNAVCSVASTIKNYFVVAFDSGHIGVFHWSKAPTNELQFKELYRIQPLDPSTSPDTNQRPQIQNIDCSLHQTQLIFACTYASGSTCLAGTDLRTQTSNRVVWIRPQQHQSQILRSCTCSAFGASASKLMQFAVGWSNSTVSLFHIQLDLMRTPSGKSVGPMQYLRDFQCLRQSKPYGAVQSITFSESGTALAVCYTQPAIAVFGLNGCRLFSTSLPNLQGIDRMFWHSNDMRLIITETNAPPAQEENDIDAEEVAIASIVECSVSVDKDGLCMCLAGESAKPGCWIRSTDSFIPRPSTGKIGPVQATGLIQGGDILSRINGTSVLDFEFQNVVMRLRQLPLDQKVQLQFIRIDYERAFDLLLALMTQYFEFQQYTQNMVDDIAAHEPKKLESLQSMQDFVHSRELTETELVLEYALRMQALHGDCHEYQQNEPRWIEFEKRAKMDGWLALEGSPANLSKERYVRLVLGFFPKWNPWSYWKIIEELLGLKTIVSPNSKNKKLVEQPQVATRVKVLEIPFLRALTRIFPTCVERGRNGILAGYTDIHVLDNNVHEPNEMHWERHNLPIAYSALAAPIRFVRQSPNGQYIAVVGTKGFVVFNRLRQKWRQFGNVHEQTELWCLECIWLTNETLAVWARVQDLRDPASTHTIASVTLRVYPVNHLANSSILYENPELPPKIKCLEKQIVRARTHTSDGKHEKVLLYLCSEVELLVCEFDIVGCLRDQDLSVECQSQVKFALPVSLTKDLTISGIFSVARRCQHQDTSSEEDEGEQDGWFMRMFLSPSSSKQFHYSKTTFSSMNRIVFYDEIGTLVVWDPYFGTTQRLATHVETIFGLSKPTPNGLLEEVYYIYSSEGLRIWIPVLDGVNTIHQRFNEKSLVQKYVLQYFQVQFPSLIPKIQQLLKNFPDANLTSVNTAISEFAQDLKVEAFALRGDDRDIIAASSPEITLFTTLDGPVLMEYEVDVSLVMIHPFTQLLVGITSEQTSSPNPESVIGCFDIRPNLQSIATMLYQLLFRLEFVNEVQVLSLVIGKFQFTAFQSMAFEHFLYQVLDGMIDEDTRKRDMKRLKSLLTAEDLPTGLDLGEITSNLARKLEPSRLPDLLELLAPSSPMEMFEIAIRDNELQTALNFYSTLAALTYEHLSTPSDAIESSGLMKVTEHELVRCTGTLLSACLANELFPFVVQILRLVRRLDHHDQSHLTKITHLTLVNDQLSRFAHDHYLMTYKCRELCEFLKLFEMELPALEASEMQNIDATQIDSALAREYGEFSTEVEFQAQKVELQILLQYVKKAQYHSWVEGIARLEHKLEARMQQLHEQTSEIRNSM